MDDVNLGQPGDIILSLLQIGRPDDHGKAVFGFDHVGVSENSVPLNPMVLLIIIPIKWL